MSAIKPSGTDKIFNIVNYTVLTGVMLIVLYPLYFVLIASISNPDAVNHGQVVFYPIGFTMEGYGKIFEDSRIWVGYRNTILYTLAGTTINVVLTLLTAYPLSRRDLAGKQWIMGYFVFTMYFSGGLIPLYVLVNNLKLYNTPYVLILLGALSVYNVIVTRTFFISTISQELLDAAFIDGCSNFGFFTKIVLPLSKAIIAVLVVFYGVGHWNQYFNALIYISKKELYPLQMVLREILIQNTSIQMQVTDESMMEELLLRERYAQLIKYGVIIVSSVPVLMLYPFAQRYFVKGVMIGSVKG
jgi:putative aldouronate transport system permease protein